MVGRPDAIGLKSFQRLVLDLNLHDQDLNTLMIKTQSGGRHIYYRMPDGLESLNLTKALEGLDIKGFRGYVILPNSEGLYGRYEFLKLRPKKKFPDLSLNGLWDSKIS